MLGKKTDVDGVIFSLLTHLAIVQYELCVNGYQRMPFCICSGFRFLVLAVGKRKKKKCVCMDGYF